MLAYIRRLFFAFSTQAALAIASLLLLLVDKSLQYKGYRWTSRWLLYTSPTPNPSTNRLSVARQTARLIDRAAARSEASCLRRSLVLWWWLRWKRIPSDILIGVNPTDGHAWVEHHHTVINDNLDVAERFMVLDPSRMSPTQIARL